MRPYQFRQVDFEDIGLLDLDCCRVARFFRFYRRARGVFRLNFDSLYFDWGKGKRT